MRLRVHLKEVPTLTIKKVLKHSKILTLLDLMIIMRNDTCAAASSPPAGGAAGLRRVLEAPSPANSWLLTLPASYSLLCRDATYGAAVASASSTRLATR